MFVDKVMVHIQAGDGGNGVVSWRHEKFIDRGGPDGGNGGDGGDIILRASFNQNTLAAFRFQKQIKAPNGVDGSKRKRNGHAGEDVFVDLPVGTTIMSADGEVLADLTENGQEIVIAQGGKGGYGNAHFISSVRQAPRIAEKGEPGDEFEAVFELKMLADVGLIGLPNAGKSTFLAAVSNAKPEIADYAFTTLRPNLGVVDIDSKASLLMADIPGLIEGASAGKGLGDEFLRHVERSSVLLHLIDIYNDDVVNAYQTIQKELKNYAVDMSKRPQIVALNKVDGFDPEMLAEKMAELKAVLPKKHALYAISAQAHLGTKELVHELQKIVVKERAKTAKKVAAVVPVIRLVNDDSWHVKKVENGWSVTGRKIERFAARTDFGSVQGVARLRDIMKKMGIMNELRRKKAEPGDAIMIKGYPKIEY